MMKNLLSLLFLQIFMIHTTLSSQTVTTNQSQLQSQSQTVITNQNPGILINEDNLCKHTEIDLDKRSHDIAEAFQKLLCSKDPDERLFVVVEGISYDGVTNVEAMEKGTLLLFTIENRSRHCYNKVFKTEEIEEFGIRERHNSHIRVHFPSSTRGKCSIDGSCGCGCEECSAEVETGTIRVGGKK